MEDVLAVVGPTATGKSGLAVELAYRLGGPDRVEVINADAYQLYRGMNIGTAKVTEAEQRGITHHQLDVLDPSEDSSVATYQEQARADLEDIMARGRRAIVVGGSGLYVRALLDHMNFPGADSDIRASIENRAQIKGTRALYDELNAKDPQAAASIGPQNERRIIRALEVIELTGQPYSANLPRQEYVYPTFTIGLDFDRGQLDHRVAQRVDLMVEQGLVQEVTELAPRLGRTAARAVGYAEILDYLAGSITLDTAIEQITANTRRLTRKQMGWFGRDPRIEWLRGESETLIEDALAAIAAHDQGLRKTQSYEPVRRSLGS